MSAGSSRTVVRICQKILYVIYVCQRVYASVASVCSGSEALQAARLLSTFVSGTLTLALLRRNQGKTVENSPYLLGSVGVEKLIEEIGQSAKNALEECLLHFSYPAM